MLVLSRKKNESIVIDDNISIVIIEIRGDKVRLGIDAPKNVTVHRKEVFEAIQSAETGETVAQGEVSPTASGSEKGRSGHSSTEKNVVHN